MKKNKKYFVNATTKNKIVQEIERKYKKIKIAIFLILEFFFILFFWYYVSIFSAVYKETQESWVIDSFTSLLFSVFAKFMICLMLSSLYLNAVKYKIEFLYDVTMFIYELG